MSEPMKPYYVSFHTAKVPKTVDHSKSSPGPAGSGADRAGYTTFRQKARVSFAWDNGPRRGDGMVPFFARSVNVFFRLDDFIVVISSDYPEGSCAYEATRRHEFDSHIARPLRIFHSYRDILIGRLNSIPMPTERAPTWVRPESIEGVKGPLEERVVQAVGAVRQELRQALEKDKRTQDSPASYRIIYDRCTPAEWARGGSR